MKSKKTFIMDFLFLAHAVIGLFFAYKQATKLLVSTEGISTSLYLCAFIYILVLFILIFKARENLPGRVINQLYLLYIIGLITYGGFLLILFYKWTRWDIQDWITSGLVLSGVISIFIFSKVKGISFSHPYIKSSIGIAVKSVPQLLVAIKILLEGGSGHDGWAILSFHFITNIRITQAIIEIRRAGWDKNRKGILISEASNELTWVAVTIAWLIV